MDGYPIMRRVKVIIKYLVALVNLQQRIELPLQI